MVLKRCVLGVIAREGEGDKFKDTEVVQYSLLQTNKLIIIHQT